MESLILSLPAADATPEKEPKRAVFIAVVGLAMSVFVRVRGRGTDLADAPAKAMLCIWRYAPRRCWISPLLGSYLHASRSGCYANGDWDATQAASRARSVRVRAKLRRTQPLPAHGSVRARSAHRPPGPGARTGQPSQTLTHTKHSRNLQKL